MPQHIRSAWLKTLGTLALLLGAAVVAGVLIGHVWMALTLTALGVLAWHYWRLRQVLRRLTARQRAEPAAGIGAWNELDRLLYRSQDEMRARKRRLIEMLRTYRAAAQALPDAVVVVDRNSQRVQWFNKAAGVCSACTIPATWACRSLSGCSRCRWRTGWRPGAMPSRCWMPPRRPTRICA